MNEDRPGSNRQTEHRVLVRPLGRSIAQTRDADPARQSSFDGSLHEFGREEGERDCHIDLSNAAFLARSNLRKARRERLAAAAQARSGLWPL